MVETAACPKNGALPAVDQIKLSASSALPNAMVGALKLAMTLDEAVIEVTHVDDVPEQAPLQPAKVEPGAAVAVNMTFDALGKLAAHAKPQPMPEGLDVIVPEPVPFLDTLSTKEVGV